MICFIPKTCNIHCRARSKLASISIICRMPRTQVFETSFAANNNNKTARKCWPLLCLGFIRMLSGLSLHYYSSTINMCFGSRGVDGPFNLSWNVHVSVMARLIPLSQILMPSGPSLVSRKSMAS